MGAEESKYCGLLSHPNSATDSLGWGSYHWESRVLPLSILFNHFGTNNVCFVSWWILSSIDHYHWIIIMIENPVEIRAGLGPFSNPYDNPAPLPTTHYLNRFPALRPASIPWRIQSRRFASIFTLSEGIFNRLMSQPDGSDAPDTPTVSHTWHPIVVPDSDASPYSPKQSDLMVSAAAAALTKGPRFRERGGELFLLSG